jgi:hypothetical protein
MKTEVIGNQHILYGDWDDVCNNQFLVYYHADCVNATVFLMGGCDYGGGVTSYFTTTAAAVYEAIGPSEDGTELGDYEAKERVTELYKESLK